MLKANRRESNSVSIPRRWTTTGWFAALARNPSCRISRWTGIWATTLIFTSWTAPALFFCQRSAAFKAPDDHTWMVIFCIIWGVFRWTIIDSQPRWFIEPLLLRLNTFDTGKYSECSLSSLMRFELESGSLIMICYLHIVFWVFS